MRTQAGDRTLSGSGDRTLAGIGVAGWLAAAISMLIFLAFAYLVGERRPIPFDASLLTWLHQHAAPSLTWIARSLSAIGEPTVVGPATLVIVILLLVLRRWRGGLLMTIQVGGAAALDEGLKHVFARPRPTLFPHLVHETTYSFPSGHAVGDLAFALALYLVAARLLPGGWRWLGALPIVLALAIGATRPYLQVHYPSDVIAGWALGLAWVLTVQGLLARRLRRRSPQAAGG